VSTVGESFLVGLIGEGVIPSLTPPMHEREADHHGLRYLYRPIDLSAIDRTASDVGVLLRHARDLGYNAFNVTHPCKQEVLAHLDDISATAAAIGAVNTVLITDGRLIGDNTDVTGFATGLRSGLPEADLSSVVLLGAGGAGAAVSHSLCGAGVRQLAIVDLDRSRADDRAESLLARYPDVAISTDTPDALPRLLPQATGLVHATCVGMHSHPGLPVPPELLRPDLWVADIVYRPLVTELVAAATALGAPVLDGGHMAVGQAVDTFRLITGLEPDAARMRTHFLELIEAGR
jgi:shikimate dehydrogenase